MARRLKPYLLHAAFRPELDLDFEASPFNIPAVRELGNITFHPNVTFFFGTVASVSPLHDALLFGRTCTHCRSGI